MNRITEAHIVWRASIHSTVKPQKSTFNSYNLFFYRVVVFFLTYNTIFEDISQKSTIFDAIIGARMNIKIGPGFYFIEDGYQDNDCCHAVNPRWSTLIDRTLFSASVNRNATLRYRKDFFHDESKGSMRDISVNNTRLCFSLIACSNSDTHEKGKITAPRVHFSSTCDVCIFAFAQFQTCCL